MNSIDDLVTLIRDEIGLPIDAGDAGRSFDEVPGWDSVHMLWLASALERATGRSISLVNLLEAQSLTDVYALAVPA
ncbi:acyl carrier protein [Micromonospora sp. NPDC005215]|uniref:acyl carrier protein n=1 Tax=unclassified Micromonospora TaxID=2617518 RepID=UPI0033B510C2